MKKVTSIIYENYPEQPYISANRDVKAWEKNPSLFAYDIVEKKQMIRLEEKVLPGHIIMLWRVNFDNFSNMSTIPLYFEYKYGVDSHECLSTLEKLGYIQTCNATESLSLLNMVELKQILLNNNLTKNGKKPDLINRIIENIPNDKLEKMFELRKYKSTSLGKDLLIKYDYIIQKHGPKM